MRTTVVRIQDAQDFHVFGTQEDFVNVVFRNINPDSPVCPVTVKIGRPWRAIQTTNEGLAGKIDTSPKSRGSSTNTLQVTSTLGVAR